MPTNRLLTRLSRSDFGLLEPHLEAVALPVRKVLVERNKRVENVFFPENGIASVVAIDGEDEMEIGMIGREGMTGVPVVLGDNERAPHQCYVQIAGGGIAFRRTACARPLTQVSHCTRRCCPTCIHS